MARYRVYLDVIADNNDAINGSLLNDMALEAVRGARLEIPPAHKRDVKVIVSGWHAHYGDEGCNHCSNHVVSDGVGQDVSDEFAI